ncbi:PDZ domain-containing protein [Trichonephila inaurata madagascariensis]|uniref:PDZ domain-containing protein n=1 Tax=Trichonephila inaurata madagascariensis TaxID=2747483 RepID=A0A8X6X6N9_9ARAC|nr:PDZ domain-containing protein [Trichonephila inaurata madagascariensis]
MLYLSKQRHNYTSLVTCSPPYSVSGETGFHLDNGDITPAQNAKASNGTTGQQQQKKNRPFSSLPFHAVFHPSGKKQRAIDDTYISKHMERIMVPLRGHDFTGLGFNICGNMRDGIFVKDVLHRGPASESGKIKAGDRIVGVTVSFGAMVYEDALTILSYASPYDVRLEIEKSPSQPLPPSPKRVGTSTSFRNSSQGRLFHPLYRSQSIMDLSQIGKDNNLSENSPGINAKNQKEATPKRSQSVEASNGGPKARPVYSLKSNDESKSLSSNKGSRKSSTSSCDSSGKVTTATTVPLPEKTQAAPAKEEAPCTKKEVPPVKPARETAETKQNTPDTDVHAVEKTLDPQPPKEELEEKPTPAEEEPSQEAEKPMAPPRKAGTPAKRKAPAPPPVNPTKTETSALVHRADEQPQEQPVLTEPPKPASNPEPPPPPTSQVPDLAASDASSLASRPDEEVEPSSPSRRKASSLGDLTHLDQGSNRKSSTSSAILERAVSMDLQQSIPGENLVKQKKILKAPTFEDDYDENREGDQNDTEGGRLKRWDDGLDKVLGGLTNGHGDHHASDPHVEEVTSPKKEEPETTETNEPEVNVPAPPKKLLKVDIDLDLSGSESSQNEDGQEDSKQQLTSTPVKKILEVNNSTKEDDISLDEVPFLASSKVETTEEESSTTTSTKHSIRTNSAPLFAPVTISIPIIKPDLKHFENLPSPPTASTHPALDPAWRVSTKVTPSDDANKSQLERISVQSLYRPIFTDKESQDLDESVPEKMANGIDSDSSEHYSTAHEADTSADTSSTLSVTLTSPTVANNLAVKAPNSAAGFAKTLIIPGPSEVESLLSLAAEPNTPPPQLDPPPKPIENE